MGFVRYVETISSNVLEGERKQLRTSMFAECRPRCACRPVATCTPPLLAVAGGCTHVHTLQRPRPSSHTAALLTIYLIMGKQAASKKPHTTRSVVHTTVPPKSTHCPTRCEPSTSPYHLPQHHQRMDTSRNKRPLAQSQAGNDDDGGMCWPPPPAS